MNEFSEGFIFPKESEETKRAVDEAENKINGAVKIFANNLDGLSPWLTKKLLDIFDEYKEQKDFKFSWLSESDLWLHALWDLYEKNKDKIPDQLEGILTEMLESLTQYRSVKQRSKTLEEMLRACAYVETASNDTDQEILWIRPSIFKPTTSNNWWREA